MCVYFTDICAAVWLFELCYFISKILSVVVNFKRRIKLKSDNLTAVLLGYQYQLYHRCYHCCT